ncbi:LPS export ABC transporter permease LptF [Paracoccus aeridis]|uniref:LPS export ABC transporter permease LptF n=1 Tax=Paracoccus aeridis TaxID=1966466 RepID=UPI0010AB3BAE|nr:LPS export ABC transporter permease LptF [Paracoccus aeridis]
MTRIDKYILSQFLGLFGFFGLVLVSVYWINRAVQLFEQLIQDGQTALVVLEFTALTLPLVISVVLPVAAFAAAAFGTNRLASESELAAMQAAGMSPWRLARPVLMFGLVAGVMVAILVHGLVPMARSRLADRQAEVAEDITARFLRAGQFQYPGASVTVFIRDIADDGRLLDVFLQDARDPARVTDYTAAQALVVRADTGPRIVMLQGMVQTLAREGDRRQLSVTRFEDLTYDLGNLLPADEDERDLRSYSTARLLSPDADLLAATGESAARARAEGHERIVQPAMAPVGALLGFAILLLGGYSRFGVWKQVAGAVVALILVQMLATAAASVTAASPDRWPLLYLPPIAGGAVVVAVLGWVARPRRVGRAGGVVPGATGGAA